MGDLRLKIGGKVDDVDCTEWAFLRTDTTSNAETFRYEGDFRIWSNFDAQLAGPYDRTGFLAFLTAFL